MSTFRAFQTGLAAGQQQAKVRREDDARQKAADAWGKGNYEGASTSLMGVGLMDEADAYDRAGQRKIEAERTKAYADAFKTGLGAGPAPNKRGGYEALGQAAAGQGDFNMMAKVDEAVAGMDEQQAEQFSKGMEFLGQTALDLKQVAPEMRGQAAMEILQNSPYANPQILQQIQQAGADGKITDEELDNFAMQTMSVADRVKASKPQLFNTGQAIVSVGPDNKASTLYRDPQQPSASQAQFVDVPPAEMEALGYPKGTLGQRNTKTNELQVKSRPSTQMTGQPSESERKYAFYTKNAKHGLDVVNSMETQQGFNRADGWTWATSWTNQDARKYDQGMSQFIDSWLRAMTGAAATPSEIDFYKQQWTPQLGDGPDVIKQKRDARNQAVVDMQAAAGRGIPQGASYAPTNGEPTASAPTFPDGTPITPETLQQLPPELRQVWARKLPAQQDDPTDDAFIDGLFSDQGADAGPPEGSGLTQQEWDLMPPEDKALFQ